MRIVTSEGRFLQGEPLQIVAQLSALERITARALVGARSRESMLLELECERVERYQVQIGSQFAEFAAERLLESLEEEGMILLHDELSTPEL